MCMCFSPPEDLILGVLESFRQVRTLADAINGKVILYQWTLADGQARQTKTRTVERNPPGQLAAGVPSPHFLTFPTGSQTGMGHFELLQTFW